MVYWYAMIVYNQSMTRMRAFVSLTTGGQWHGCMHSCHWPLVNDTDACIRVIDRSQWHRCMHSCHWPLVNDTDARIRVIDCGQWHHCIVFKLHSSFCIVFIEKLYLCHWLLYKGVQKSLIPALVPLTIGQWHECNECDLHSAFCIRVIDQTAFVSSTAP